MIIHCPPSIRPKLDGFGNSAARLRLGVHIFPEYKKGGLKLKDKRGRSIKIPEAKYPFLVMKVAIDREARLLESVLSTDSDAQLRAAERGMSQLAFADSSEDEMSQDDEEDHD